MNKKWARIFLALPAWLIYIVLALYRTVFLIVLAFIMLFALIMNIPLWINSMIWKLIIDPILAMFSWILDIINWIRDI
jgi:hypothetical protein